VRGSLHVAKCFKDGALLAVVVGLGFPQEAAVSARIAAITLKRYARETASALVNRCHRNLMMSSGAVMGLAAFDEKENLVGWLGVRNVRGLLVREKAGDYSIERLPHYTGVVGYYFPVVHETILALNSGDTLILASDGIGEFEPNLGFRQMPQPMADCILENSFRGTSDATVLVARHP
jgi:hypothetical protein